MLMRHADDESGMKRVRPLGQLRYVDMMADQAVAIPMVGDRCQGQCAGSSHDAEDALSGSQDATLWKRGPGLKDLFPFLQRGEPCGLDLRSARGKETRKLHAPLPVRRRGVRYLAFRRAPPTCCQARLGV